MSNKIKTLFIGTPDFAVPGLKALIDSPDFDVVAVITQPDKPAGRKQEIAAPPVKVLAASQNIPVHQPKDLTTFHLPLSTLDLIILIAYAQLLPSKLLDSPKYGAINVHASLLPKYRGSSCIQYPIMNGDKESGITLMKMDEGLDTGPIIKQYKVNIGDKDTAGTLSDKLANLSAEILPQTLKEYIAGKLKPRPQPTAGASFAPELKKQDGLIDWNKPAIEIERFIRAMTPWPGAFAQVKSEKFQPKADPPRAEKVKSIKILTVNKTPIKINAHPIGTLFTHTGKLAVQCGIDALEIEILQLPGKKPLSAKEFLNGYPDMIGVALK